MSHPAQARSTVLEKAERRARYPLSAKDPAPEPLAQSTIPAIIERHGEVSPIPRTASMRRECRVRSDGAVGSTGTVADR